MNVLQTDKISRNFGGLQAVDKVDLSIEANHIHAIIGPNGAGKTTLMNLISGRVTPSSGTIRLSGQNITALPAWRKTRAGIAYTFQITSIYPKFTCFDHLALSLQRTVPARDVVDRVDAALTSAGLVQFRDVPAGLLSYGHQRMLEMAMTMALRPVLLILDEPTQGLAEGEIAAFCRQVRTVISYGTVLLIEHNMDVVMNLADRITVMDQGAVLAEGDPQTIRDDGAVQRAYLGVTC